LALEIFMRNWIILFIAVVLVVLAGVWIKHRSAKPAAPFVTAPITRGDLAATILATGTVEPEEVVDVGSQLSGTLDYFGKDIHQPGKLIDYGSEVDNGEVLCHLDDSLYAANAASAQAMVEQGKANVQKARADLDEFKAKLLQASNDWKRAQEAGSHAGLSESDIDQYRANYYVAIANVADGEAAIKQAETGQAQSEAQLKYARRNLDYCTIISPVKGTVIDRRVNIGQTVAASLNAPSLFLIAKDLKRMQVWASVNEADIGSIHPGQTVTFTADAFPTATFIGTVGKIRLNATMTSNVVTYTVEIETDNSNGKLLPYLTANVKFQVDKHDNVLMIPNAALRWTPLETQIAPDARNAPASPAGADVVSDQQTHGTLWAADGQFVRPVPVRLGLTDGADTEVIADNLSEGTSIVTADAAPEEPVPTGGSPFLPQFGKKRK
jgi:HlyD family secretion protein